MNMKQNLKDAMLGINNFVWMAVNYGVVPHTFYGGEVKYVPRFVEEVKWSVNTDHFANKWLGIADADPHGYGRLIKFYLELDNANKLALMEWIMENPVDQRELSVPEE